VIPYLAVYCAWMKNFPVVLFVIDKVVLSFEFENEILKCDHLTESYKAVVSLVLFSVLSKVVLTFEFMDEILTFDHSNFRVCG